MERFTKSFNFLLNHWILHKTIEPFSRTCMYSMHVFYACIPCMYSMYAFHVYVLCIPYCIPYMTFCKCYSGWVHLARRSNPQARRQKTSSKAGSAANCSKYAKTLLERSFWMGSVALGQKAENSQQGQISNRFSKVGRNSDK